MEFKNKLNKNLFGLIGSILLILSEFFSWLSEYNLIEIYIITTSVEITDSFLYLFPLTSGIICLAASILIMYKIEFKIKSVILSTVGLGFLIIFFLDYFTQEFKYIPNAGIGFYLGVIGFLLIIFNILNMLITFEK
ncbi:MAG: hypothetical protein ACFFB0_12015 [Promethearchaeota archaeon]